MQAHTRVTARAGFVLATVGVLLLAGFAWGCQQEAAVTQGTASEGGAVVTDSITTSGQGTVLAAPDEALLFVTVETQAEQAAQAVDENAKAMDSVRQRLLDEGVPEGDLETSNVTVFPERPPMPAGSTTSETQTAPPDTFRATNTMQVTIRNLERVGEIYSAAVAAGANNVRGPEWRLSDDSVAVQEALKKAATSARAKAAALAESEGVTVGDVVTMREDSAGAPPVLRAAADSAGGQEVAPVPVSPQNLEVTASVTVTYRLER